MKIRLYRNTSNRAWGYGTLPMFGKGKYGKRIRMWWLGPVFIQYIP